MPPPYGPRLDTSKSSMICIARTFGAPETVPTGKAARNTSQGFKSSISFPVTVDEICMTCEYRSISMSFSTLTVPICETLPTSFRPKSTSMTCSALSFSSANKSSSNARSSACVLPLARVPAKGLFTTVRESSTRHKISGDDAINMQSLPW